MSVKSWEPTKKIIVTTTITIIAAIHIPEALGPVIYESLQYRA